VLVTVNAMLQKVAPADVIDSLGFSAKPGNQVRMDDIAARLERNGFDRVGTVREVGEFAVRGGILDVFVPGAEEPVRLDFFGDTLESIRSFDPASQRTIAQVRSLDLNPMSEVTLTPESISRFRKNYLSLFGAATRDDALYAAVSEGRRYAGMEHWLPMFYDKLETTFDYLRGFRMVTDHTVREAAEERAKLIRDYYEARLNAATPGKGHLAQGTPYKPVPPERLYLGASEFGANLDAFDPITSSPSLALDAGDLVVHVDHGIGRFVGLKTIEAAGAPHDCLEIHYAGGDQALPAGREHRAAVALRLGGRRGRSSTSSAAAPGRRARPS
jgi:transcription-repair coupling factor (superfamily II helicase)